MKPEDKQVLDQFQCDANRLAEELFAQTLSENDRVRLFFINENEAFTDGRNIITDPARDGLFCDDSALKRTAAFLNWPFSLLWDRWTALQLVTRAQTIHECLHLLYSDFPPPASRYLGCDNLTQRTVLGLIANILEDAYIEAAGCSVFDAMELFLRFGRVARLFASRPSEGTAQRRLSGEHTDRLPRKAAASWTCC